MKLVESYIEEAGLELPDDMRADVQAELRELIEEQVQDRAESEQREPTLDDERAVLQGLGHPVKMARSYLPQRFLIGPNLYPDYLHVLKVALAIVITLRILVGLAFGKDLDAVDVIMGALGSALPVFAIVTGIFAALEASGDSLDWQSKWTPDSLRTGSRAAVNVSDLTISLIAEGVGLLWWNGILDFPVILGQVENDVTMTAAWDPLYWPFNVVFGVSLVLHLFVLARGHWRIRTLLLELGLGASTLVMIVYLLRCDPLVSVETVELEKLSVMIGWSVRGLIASIGAFVAWDLFSYGRLARRLRSSLPS